MTAHSTPRSTRAAVVPRVVDSRRANRAWHARVALARALAAATAALLAVDAYVHVLNAASYDGLATSSLGEGTLFRGQAVVAIVVAIAVLAWPRRVVWLAAALVAGSAAAAVVLFTYVDAGALGPLPDLYQPTWALPGKIASAFAETAASGLAIVGFVLASRPKPTAANMVRDRS